jgi:general secretion pathway protein I
VIRHGTAGGRPGLTLIEVLVALAIFLLSLAAISRLVTFAGQRALDARRTDEASRLARSKFAEVYAGVVPLESSDDTPFDEEPDYSWSLTADSASMTGLWVVSVTVKRKGDDGPGFTLREYMLDPTIRGSTQDSVIITGSTNVSTGTGTGNSSTSPTMSGGGAAAAGKAGAGKGASSAPAAGKSMPAAPAAPTKSSSSSGSKR